ncbi:hypothetical protein [Mesorhizobium sp. B2-8-5]|uniref:hypothetical protein n=1 Tax=Mesorhizobium sp. B2-8-5 TaxID=2589903 RepID=UPI001129D9F9|nr:hypothetical protein [Mesorhizobium sp. B2-8-5]UCI23197.1 hypothetical protein FJ430_16325 [Mesorhizobium sp. B2-8-5]
MNKDLCTQAYSDILDFSARLAAYSTSSFPEVIGHGHYESRAKQLAIRDLILLCISVRRLAELTKQHTLLKNKSVPGFNSFEKDGLLEIKDSEKSFNAWEIVGNIIHAKTIDVINSDAEFSIYLRGHPSDILDHYNLMPSRKSINGIIIIVSDRGYVKYFEIYKFVKIIVDFTDQMDDFLAENKIFVGQLYEW